MRQRKKHVRGAFAIPMLLLMFAGGVRADVPFEHLQDLHLNVVPRTASEVTQVRKMTALPTDFTALQPGEDRPAGSGTVTLRHDANAFSQPFAHLSPEEALDFTVGNTLFRMAWQPAQADSPAADGLGPLYNAASCEACHARDGRGHPPQNAQEGASSLFLQLSIPAETARAAAAIKDYIATAPDPVYGAQLQDVAIAGHTPEMQLAVTYTEEIVTLADGTRVSLRKPTYTPQNLAFGPLHAEVMLSPRIAPQMIGLGLLEAIPKADILAWADPEDRDGDGVSGRANVVWSAVHDQPMLGRFGLKAGSPTILEQSALAFAIDMGISNPIFPKAAGDCTPAQTACTTGPHGDGDARVHEIDAVGLDLVAAYSGALGVPERRDPARPEVLRGKRVFHDSGCAACHRPSFVTHRLTDRSAHGFQLIWPYTDMLLHDMGPGLADNRPEARATGHEWRTPPLWGIGLTQQVSGQVSFLHDGRARSLLEAILWHGGEAAGARDKVVTLSGADRAALIAFLESL